ncbi:MAG TPA: DUF2071 domain-containing protein [Verrucomicrobiae bacterium]|nr:DUF2071 domain-containing protein [Verrucomicrobiae bacterium]
MESPIARVPSSFLTAEWHNLAMLNYEIDPAVLRAFVPNGTELDSWNGKAYVSMVGFMFLKTRVRRFAIPFHQNFEEINLRFYVRRKGPDGWRRGVVFIKEIVPRFAIALIARMFYNENYVALATRNILETSAGSITAEYGWRLKGRWNCMRVKTSGAPRIADEGSLEEFITEHYWGYAAQKDGSCVEYKVEHPRWRIWQTKEVAFDCDVEALYGERFAGCLKAKPSSAFLAEGSPVVVYSGTKLQAR